MKRIKRIMVNLFLAGAIALPLSANAAVTTDVFKNGDINYNIPVVSLENKPAAEKINNLIQSNFNPNKYINSNDTVASLNYEVAYEDNDLLSIVISDYEYEKGAAHGMQTRTGLVFDKHTGKSIPLDFFLKIKNMDEFYKALDSGELVFLNQAQEPITHLPDFKTLFMSNSYFLGGNGSIYVIFQPYELGPYSYGATLVYFSKEMVDKFNQNYNS